MLSYFLISSLSLCLLYAIYWAFLRQETFFRLNRYFLLCAATLSLLVPFFSISITGTSLWLLPVTDASVTLVNEMGSRLSIEPVLQNLEPAKTVLQTENTMAIKTSQTAYFQLLKFYWQEILLAIYLLGLAYQLFFFLKGLKCIYSLISKNEKTKQGNYYLVSYQGNKGVFSFLNYLFWSKQIPDNELIKKHELTHISQKHSLDILFFELLNIVFWCNPIIRLYQKSMRLVHEYLADEAVTAQLSTKTTYTYALVAQATQGTKLSLLHHFSQSKPLKQRIMKIYQEKSKPQARRKYWLALPAIAICLFIAACQKQDFQNDSQTYIKQEIPTHIPQDFQEKMKELQAQHPTYFFEYRPLYAAFMQRDLDEAAENMNDEKIMFHRPISKQEYYNYEKGEHERAIAILIKEEGENSKIVQERKQYFSQLSSSYVIDQPMIGYIYMRKKPRFGSWDEEVEDLNAYTEVDEYPSPRDGEAFYEEMFKMIGVPEYFKKLKPTDLQGNLVFELVVQKTGGVVKLNIIEELQITASPAEIKRIWDGKSVPPQDCINGGLFHAFQNRSAFRGWKAGVKNGKRVDTKIRFKIPVEMVRKVIFNP